MMTVFPTEQMYAGVFITGILAVPAALIFVIMSRASAAIEKHKHKQKKKRAGSPVYRIAFCDTADLSTKFGEYQHDFASYDEAKNMIFSKVSGWGMAIQDVDGDKALIDGGWLIIEQASQN